MLWTLVESGKFCHHQELRQLISMSFKPDILRDFSEKKEHKSEIHPSPTLLETLQIMVFL